jgi:flagellum-specific peptidoglycan hydrolase FlgJ
VKKYTPLVDSLSKAYGIPSCIIFGVAILESGSGTSQNAKLLNNHFGIIGKNNLIITKGIKSRYKQYSNIAGSYVDFCKLLARKKYYKKLKGTNDCGLWVEAIASAGYSTMPEEWKKRVLAVIRKNKLDTP